MSNELPFNDRIKTYSEWKKEMIDDSLSDTQQENKMSVERLVLKDVQKEIKMHVDKDKADNFNFMSVENGETIWLIIDRSQAHLLMLYLQEHLGYVSISKDRLK